MLFHLGARIQFREINAGKTSIRALTPQNHGLIPIEGSVQPNMFSNHALYSSFLDLLGHALERSEFDERHCYLAGILYFQENCRLDMQGFVESFRFLEDLVSPVYRYLKDMPAIGNVEQLRGFLPFQRVLYGFVAGLSSDTIGRLWSLQSYLFYRVDRAVNVQVEYLRPERLVEKTADSIRHHLQEHPGALNLLSLEEMLSQHDLTIPSGGDLYSHVAQVVYQRWGGDFSAYDSSDKGVKLMLDVCAFYTAAAVILANSV